MIKNLNILRILLMSFASPIVISTNVAYAQELKTSLVHGVVSNGLGKEMPGVTIKEKGGKILGSTDENGNFSISVTKSNPTLIFSFIGYQEKEVFEQDSKEIKVVMQESQDRELDEVVVIGYGTQRKGDVTGAISSVGVKDLKDQPVVNLQGALQGKSSGVQITQNSGAPGAGAQVRIRGLTSINNSDPLYVVDGIPLASNDINIIDPNNIESIDILKDASAQAIYGSRGANGVILVKTKSGSGEKASISFNSQHGVSHVRRLLEMVSSADYVKLHNEAYSNAGQTSPFKESPETYSQTTDWQKELFRTAYMQNYNVALAGGSPTINYRFSGGYLDQQGTIKGSDYNRINISNNLTFRPKKSIEIGESIILNRSITRNVSTDFNANLINDALAMDPTIPVKNGNGEYTATAYSDIINPLARVHYLYSNWPYKQWGILANTYLQYKPVDGLTLKSSYSLDLKFSDNKQFTPIYNVAPNFNNPNARLYQQKDMVNSWTWDNTANYKFSFSSEHNFDVLGGVSAQRFSYDYLNGQNQGQPGNDPFLQYLDAGISGQQIGGREQNWSLLSFMARMNYNYKNTYFVTATYRRDGSSKFGKNNKFGNFPSASLGWNITNEEFFPKNEIVNNLKIRGSWGIVGNQSSVGYYDYAANINTNYYSLGIPALAVPVSEPGGLSNPNLRWEQVRQWNAGFDFSLLGSSLTGSFDIYNKRTEDMLMSLNIPSISGFTRSPRQNTGTMENSGVEFSANYKHDLSDDLHISIGGHFATIKNRIIKLMQEGQRIFSGNIKPGQTELTQVGHPVASFYGYVTDGIFQSQQEVDGWSKQHVGTGPGDIRFKDLNGDGVVDERDQTFLGSPIPNFTYGFNLSTNYKQFDFSAFFSGVSGNKVLAAYKYYTNGFFISNYNLEKETLNRWTGPQTSNHIPRLIASDPNNNSRVSDYYLQNGAFLRLQNVTLGYTLKSDIIKGINNARIYLSAQNLLTFSKYTGYDPEVGQQYSGAGGTLDIGIDNGNYPQSRIISAGINFSF